jgi:hypothetical protein
MPISTSRFFDRNSALKDAQRIANTNGTIVYLIQHVDEWGRPFSIDNAPPRNLPFESIRPD